MPVAVAEKPKVEVVPPIVQAEIPPTEEQIKEREAKRLAAERLAAYNEEIRQKKIARKHMILSGLVWFLLALSVLLSGRFYVFLSDLK